MHVARPTCSIPHGLRVACAGKPLVARPFRSPCAEQLRGQNSAMSQTLRLPIETRSRPRLLAATRHGFTFYVADPVSSIHEQALWK